LPALDPSNEFFWKSGADGKLRFQRCEACARLIHPPSPICPRCRVASLGVAEVSGRATVVGITVNHQAWSPADTEPFALASIAIDEDPEVRLTTRLVDCDPAQVRVGQRVQVRFEAAGDVWLPLAAPTNEALVPGAKLPRVAPSAEEIRAAIRPMARAEKFEDKVALTGIGMSKIGRRLMLDPLALTLQACERAIEDAGLRYADIDGLSTYPGGDATGGFSEGGISAVEDALRIRPTWYNGGGDTFGPAGSVIAAMLAVSAGLCRHVLCFRTVWQSTFTELVRTGRVKSASASSGIGVGLGRVAGPMQWLLPFGYGSAAHSLGINASHHFARYGTTRETLGWIALNARANAALNPDAIYRDPMSMDDYLGARMVATPFGLYDCDVPCDASIAVIVSAKDAARDTRKQPVFVEAVGTQLVERPSWDQSTLSHEPQVLGPAAHLWTRTALKPKDVDLALLYDGFSFNCLSWLEGLGFCGIGEAKDFLAGGKNIARDGLIPLNPHGGQLSAGRTHGMGFVHEAIVQLRGEAGARQIANAEVAVVSSGGLTPAGVLLLRNS
jgi:acetyl-CoA acetyltransferase/uncharacterized OB-fold protein